jgi:hypothetical protein
MSTAEVIACVFPAHRKFALDVVQMFDFVKLPKGPYPNDRLTYRSPELVEYRTAPQSEGLGTFAGRTIPSSDPISGFAALTGPDTDLILLRVRLPANLRSLAPIIIQHAERAARH